MYLSRPSPALPPLIPFATPRCCCPVGTCNLGHTGSLPHLGAAWLHLRVQLAGYAAAALPAAAISQCCSAVLDRGTAWGPGAGAACDGCCVASGDARAWLLEPYQTPLVCATQHLKFLSAALQPFLQIGSLVMTPEYNHHFDNFFKVFMSQLQQVVPPTVNLPEA
jgi:hypothetical protein